MYKVPKTLHPEEIRTHDIRDQKFVFSSSAGNSVVGVAVSEFEAGVGGVVPGADFMKPFRPKFTDRILKGFNVN
jgi:hypothetical protein